MNMSLIVRHDEATTNCGLRDNDKHIRVTITDRKSKYDFYWIRASLSLFFRLYIFSLLFTVCLSATADLSPRTWTVLWVLIWFLCCVCCFLRLCYFSIFMYSFSLGGKEGWHSLCSKCVSFVDIRYLKVSNAAYFLSVLSSVTLHTLPTYCTSVLYKTASWHVQCLHSSDPNTTLFLFIVPFPPPLLSSFLHVLRL